MNTTKTATEGTIQAMPGNTQYPGITKRADGYEFTIEAPKDKEAFLLLYRKKENDILEIPFPKESRKGNLLSLFIKGLPKGEILYNYRIGEEIVQDPYAKYLCNTPEFGKKQDEEQKLCSGYKKEDFHWTDCEFKTKKLSESILYKLQVRSFTMHKNSRVRKKGTFQGLEQKIPYLSELGITGVLLMPVYEYREIMRNRRKAPGGKYITEEMSDDNVKVNCWGYTGDACYFAPKAAFAASADPVREFKHLVDSLHAANMECLLEFYFDHTAAPSKMLDILRFWTSEYHVDGFHLMGTGICREMFMKDPLLADSKLFFHDIDGSAVYTEECPVEKNAAEYNEGFLYCMRHILKGDENALEEFIYRNKRNPRYNGIINYMADQDGFTMMDMVSYEERHNEVNGEKNQDGIEYNCSWNCGVEGTSRKQAVKELRLRQLKNAFLLLLASQGTPLIFQGDEFGNSQNGNNNAWCQDNEIGWVDWNAAKSNKKLFEFVKQLIAFRKENPILHMEKEAKCADYKALGYPDLSYHGNQAWYVSKESGSRHIGMMYSKAYCGTENEFLYIAYNFHWVEHELALPGGPDEIAWKIFMRTDEENGEISGGNDNVIKEKTIDVPPRTILILTGKQDEKACGSGSILKRLHATSF